MAVRARPDLDLLLTKHGLAQTLSAPTGAAPAQPGTPKGASTSPALHHLFANGLERWRGGQSCRRLSLEEVSTRKKGKRASTLWGPLPRPRWLTADRWGGSLDLWFVSGPRALCLGSAGFPLASTLPWRQGGRLCQQARRLPPFQSGLAQSAEGQAGALSALPSPRIKTDASIDAGLPCRAPRERKPKGTHPYRQAAEIPQGSAARC